MKAILTIICYCYLSICASQIDLAKGDTLYVIAKSGLQLREKPNLKSIKIKNVEYASSVILDSQLAIIDTIDYRIGHWSLVNYKNIKGYMFDGYLIKNQPPTFDELGNEDLVGYMLRVHKFNPEINCIINFEIPSESDKSGGPTSVMKLSENLVYRIETNYECRTHQFIFNKNHRQGELFSLIDLFFSFSKKNKTIGNTDLKSIFNFEKWTIVFPGYGIGFDYHVKQYEALIAYYECN